VQRHKLGPTVNQVGSDYFNGIDTIAAKTGYALDRGLGGVMVWELGQDCRVNEVKRGGKVHVKTCPAGRESSLLWAISTRVAGARKSEL
jgi:GH18 family chitinase